MVKNKKGFQLHVGESRLWIREIIPGAVAIPRYLLIDREGNFANSKAHPHWILKQYKLLMNY